MSPAVLSEAEHALGNLFQRIHHVTRVARDGLGPYADRLDGAVHDLEDLLELVFDYVSPVELDLRPTDTVRVAESLAAQFRGFGPVQLPIESCPHAVLLADGRVLSRSFQLLGRALGREVSPAGVAIEVALCGGADQARVA